MDVIYLISNFLDYDKLICNDAGPAYAESMNWSFKYLIEFEVPKQNQIFVIDNRITEDEVELLNLLFSKHPKTIFLLKIVDPYYEHAAHFYYSFIQKSSKYKNVFLLSVYEEKELTEEFKKLYHKRFVYIPYPYLKHRERNLEKDKKNKVIISGALNKDVYPYRYGIWTKVTRSLVRSVFFYTLRHPGYAELNNKINYERSIVKDNFIVLLAGFKYMLLCPSRCFIEFLKFHECAYAGCIPVGIAPTCYPRKIREHFLPLRLSHFYSDFLKLVFRKKSIHCVLEIRNFLYETRNPNVLNKTLKNFIIETTLHTS